MSGIALETVNPVVFDDPGKCSGYKWDICKYKRPNFVMNDETEQVERSGWICWLFDYEFPPCSNEKCQKCKDHYQKAIEAKKVETDHRTQHQKQMDKHFIE